MRFATGSVLVSCFHVQRYLASASAPLDDLLSCDFIVDSISPRSTLESAYPREFSHKVGSRRIFEAIWYAIYVFDAVEP